MDPDILVGGGESLEILKKNKTETQTVPRQNDSVPFLRM
jgi:hypothetical protein